MPKKFDKTPSMSTEELLHEIKELSQQAEDLKKEVYRLQLERDLTKKIINFGF